jgi:hypothetical protein
LSKTELRTRRLIGTPASPSDFADIRRLHSDSRVMATLSADGNTFSEEQSRAFLERAADHWKACGSAARLPAATSSAMAESGTRPSKAATKLNWHTRSALTTGAKGSRPKFQSPH